ncbi:MAG: PilT/PilU family type 4a pilus ATPase [Gammaproteobacteria bacterium]|nr:PilT/PilU family type 4a pilus ATPase [Gammaproteobacteria bacterium]NNC97891.1 PilT/PilU family type 4a pilus ATPase [Gammaproteobacteria bacterium]NNM13540.1 PilT/PilU family type 4a pilus ATPase [Gammaproteobacteria bacterium]
MNIKPLLKIMAEKRASDLFLSPFSPIKIKIDGVIRAVNNTILDVASVKAAAMSIMTQSEKEQLIENLEVDFAISESGLGRFRVNVFHQRSSIAMVLRFISPETPRLEDLDLPDKIPELIMGKRGLVLMVGATGSGKSTTLAAMLDHRNENSSSHILTVEDPIEFLHKSKKSIVNQRELGTDTHSYHNALRSAVREAPDVILIGEIRDGETMETALTLAGTGHLTVATLHANNAAETLDRIINMFPQERHHQILTDMSQYLNAIISQRLVIMKNGKRCAAVEVMMNTPHIRELILKNDISSVKEALNATTEGGMQSFDSALYELYASGKVSLEEALLNADSKADLEARINFG